jgi:hypothetical protein
MSSSKVFLDFPRIIAVCSGLLFASTFCRIPANAQESTKHTAATKAKPTRQPSEQDIVNAKSQGLVWVNTSTRVYYKGGDNYGRSKHGKFMSEAEARQQGSKPAKEPPDGAPIPHKKDQSGIDATPESHSNVPPKQ